MCLAKITGRPWLPFSKYNYYRKGKGWKVMIAHADSFEGKYMEGLYVPNEGYTTKKKLITSMKYKSYIAGFHIWLEKPIAYNWTDVVVEVEFEEGTVLGTDQGLPTVVAKRMRIISNT